KMVGCGLLTAKKNPVPLKSVEVELQVKDHVATVISTLNYQNKEDKPIEALFVFPLPGDAAVCHFSADIGQTHIVAELKEKQQAREEYDDALSSGQQAFLLEESEQSPDIFSLSVGSLPPGESASIRLQYVIELAVEADGALRFCLPAVLNPRYQPQGPGVPVSSVPASEIPYSLSFSARVSSPRPVSKVESSCSLEPLQYLNTDHTEAAVKLAAGHKFDRDVELLIYYKDAHQPSAVVEAGQDSAQPGTLMGDPVVMVSLYPEFPESVVSKRASCGEFVFLVDRSGSMDCPTNNWNQQETRISSARDTLLLLLKSLPMGCYFNIYGFGSSYDHIFLQSVEYSEKSMEEALKKVKVMQADLGGTEILQPLQHIYSQPCISNQPRQLKVANSGSAPPFQGWGHFTGAHNPTIKRVLIWFKINHTSQTNTPSPARDQRSQPRRDPLLQLVSLQKASGCWLLDAALASVLGKTSEEVEKSKPAEVSSEVWATILALIWLHGFKMDAKDEWELLAVKAASWVQAQNAPCVKDCVDASNALLGCRVHKEALGL
uniref:VIT domain-containing protein n=1 Tax=Oryzias latipes TaxID=8090 RepID=A0A3P9JHQ8_ORYLA